MIQKGLSLGAGPPEVVGSLVGGLVLTVLGSWIWEWGDRGFNNGCFLCLCLLLMNTLSVLIMLLMPMRAPSGVPPNYAGGAAFLCLAWFTDLSDHFWQKFGTSQIGI